jgi:hypothetical protein
MRHTTFSKNVDHPQTRTHFLQPKPATVAKGKHPTLKIIKRKDKSNVIDKNHDSKFLLFHLFFYRRRIIRSTEIKIRNREE